MKLRHFGWGLVFTALAFMIVFGNDRIREAGLKGAIGGAAIGLLSGLVWLARLAWANRGRSILIELGQSTAEGVPETSVAGRFAGGRHVFIGSVSLIGVICVAVFVFPSAEDYAHGLLSLRLGPTEHDSAAALNAAVGDNVEGLRRALRRGVSPNSRYGSSRTLLSNAVENGSYNAAELLLSKGANPNWRNLGTLETPLHTAVRTCRLDLVKLLVGVGASVCIQNAKGRWPVDAFQDFKCEDATRIISVLGSLGGLRCKVGEATPNIFDEMEP